MKYFFILLIVLFGKVYSVFAQNIGKEWWKDYELTLKPKEKIKLKPLKEWLTELDKLKTWKEKDTYLKSKIKSIHQKDFFLEEKLFYFIFNRFLRVQIQNATNLENKRKVITDFERFYKKELKYSKDLHYFLFIPSFSDLYAMYPINDFLKVKNNLIECMEYATRHKNYEEIAKLKIFLGRAVYGNLGNTLNALSVGLEANALIEKYPTQISDDAQMEVLDYLGRIYLRNNEIKKSTIIFEKLLKLFEKLKIENRSLIQIYNNLALGYQKERNFDKSYFYFDKINQVAQKQQDSAWIGINAGNLGYNYYLQQNYEKAIQYFKIDYEYSCKFKEYASAFNVLETLGATYQAQNNFIKALEIYQKADSLYLKHEEAISNSSPTNALSTKKGLHLNRVKIYELTGEYQKALFHQKQAYQLIQSLNKKNKEAEKEQQKALQTFHDSELKQIQENNSLIQRQFLLLSILGIVFTLLVIFIASTYIFRLRYQYFETQKELEKERNWRLTEEISLKERQLTTTSLQIHQKSDFLKNMEDHLKESVQKSNPEVKYELKKILKEIKQQDDLEQQWENFKMHFEEVHNHFFENLKNNFPNLTDLDLRVCAYLRMNLDNKTIARLLNILPSSFKMSRTRLRKKLNLNTEEDLSVFLMQF